MNNNNIFAVFAASLGVLFTHNLERTVVKGLFNRMAQVWMCFRNPDAEDSPKPVE